ncbi:MAG: OsmC family protein [Cyclobacteriaceae bacterium]|jgi:peroxiredoxin-like protein|nr:OsmC family protein [Flammeovirgaceae bacterium]
MEHYYDVNVMWEADRQGVLSSTVLPQTIDVATPPEFPKGMAGIWSPEHLLVGAVSSCLMTTFLAIAENSKLEFKAFQCAATGKLELIEGKYMISEIELKPVVTLKEGKDRERAERIVQKAEAACLITNSIKSKVTMLTRTEVKDPASV